MPYAALLNQLIVKSGLSSNEVARRCTELGQKVTASYISILRRPENERIPSDEMSRALARACGAEPEILVIEAYIDKAPPELGGLVAYLKNIVMLSVLANFENTANAAEMAEIQKHMDDQPLAGIVLMIQQSLGSGELEKLAGAMNFTQTNSGEGFAVTTQMSAAAGIMVQDDSMFPVVPQYSQVTLEAKTLADYQDGDILCFIRKDDEAVQCRKVAFLNPEHSQMALFAINPDYETRTYAADEVAILGKVRQVVTNLK